MIRSVRHLSTLRSTPRVAVVGAGPAGFYTAHRLLKLQPDTKIDLFESLPVPYGLARHGVAPDHPEVKNCQDTFDEVGNDPRVQFFGNVTVGDTLPVSKLRDNYNAVVLSYGTHTDRKLGIPGEDLPGVISARTFVNWYNGHPEHESLNPPLHKAETVTIVGNGNVALDIARILLSPLDHLKSTDITQQAYETLKTSKVKRVRIMARRGLLESAFTIKEIRELFKLPDTGFVAFPHTKWDDVLAAYKSYKRPLSRIVKLIEEYNLKAKQRDPAHASTLKQWSLDYLLSPKEVIANPDDPELVKTLIATENKLVSADGSGRIGVEPTGVTESFDTDLIFTSIGYASTPLEGIPFDDRKSVIPSSRGRVTDNGVYAAGWVKNGPTGVIATTMADSFDTAQAISDDITAGKLDGAKSGSDNLTQYLEDAISWDQWKKLEAHEHSQGDAAGKPREKVNNVAKMLEIARQ